MKCPRLRLMAALLGASLGCRTPPQAPATPPTSSGEAPPREAIPPVAQAIPAQQRVLLIRHGREEYVDAREAVAAGFTLIDLGDDWTPSIFQDWQDDQGRPRPHRYRRIFIGLANDRLDDDGQPLAPGEHNYLELYGIPPSLSVLGRRFRQDAARSCEGELDLALLAGTRQVRYIPPERLPVLQARIARLRRSLELRRKAVGYPDLTALAAAEPQRADEVAEVQRWDAEQAVLRMVERRLTCEGLAPGPGHRRGVYDDALREAIRRFQHKHMIYEAPYLRPRTMAALGRSLQENNYAALRRVITERVVSAAAILEDGSVQEQEGGSQGKRPPVRNLVEEYTDEAMRQLGLGSPAEALAFFQRHPDEDFRRLWAAVRLPPRPAYYSDHMDLDIVVDRGDVWYDFPFDDKGKEVPQPRQRYPRFLLYVRHGGERFPLISWRTTIGGWRSEQAEDGYEYYRYKGSDVGPRVIRTISSGPVWIAPPSTPIRTLVKRRRVAGAWQSVVNYDELGPGFRSAYGLVAGYFVVPGEHGKPDFDNGIRAHGSAEYLSIDSGGFSHGCHRLLNHLAVRLYSFILAHRRMHVKGDQPLGYSRQFLFRDEVYEIRLPSRGYHFVLDPPLPVQVLEGRIRGERKKPIEEYMPKPGVIYPGPPPRPGRGIEDRTGGAAARDPAEEAP
ncbi:MAG: hypothetical protein RMK29_07390 [Myxococcales bacterium]|nr:hypothetical protein [Myxococcota bacterium]MDW8281517.1 hypothetical protein [Myxococcales bacterium]